MKIVKDENFKDAIEKGPSNKDPKNNSQEDELNLEEYIEGVTTAPVSNKQEEMSPKSITLIFWSLGKLKVIN